MTTPAIPADVVVVGTGAAALAAAVAAHDRGARVVVIERSPSVGGTTAVSGGGIWMPRNHHMAERGVDDSRAEALAYMTTMTAGRSPTALLERYVDRGPDIVAELERTTPLRLAAMSWPDYHPEMDGAKPAGRMLVAPDARNCATSCSLWPRRPPSTSSVCWPYSGGTRRIQRRGFPRNANGIPVHRKEPATR